MSAFVSARLDTIRGCADKARVCAEWAITTQVTIRTRRWTEGRLEAGVALDSDLILPKRFPVRQLSQREISSSGGKFNEGDVIVEDISPEYRSHGGGGFAVAQLDPSIALRKPAKDTEILYVLDGDQTGIFSLVSLDSSSDPASWSMVLRNTRLSP